MSDTRRRYRPGGYSVFQPPQVFVLTGEFRAPRKGEHYISGAIPEAYHAPNDLSSAYHIAIQVPERRVRYRRGVR